MRRRRAPSVPRVDIVNRSVKECLGRTVNTTATTLITIVMLYVLGVASIREFALPIIIGIVSGVAQREHDLRLRLGLPRRKAQGPQDPRKGQGRVKNEKYFREGGGLARREAPLPSRSLP